MKIRAEGETLYRGRGRAELIAVSITAATSSGEPARSATLRRPLTERNAHLREAGATATAPLLASELPHYSEAETRVALHSAFARYAGEFRVGGVLRPRQERRIPVHRRS